jgi:hypothetical protein
MILCEKIIILQRFSADVAQLVEQLICNQPVGGSSPSIGSFIGDLRSTSIVLSFFLPE